MKKNTTKTHRFILDVQTYKSRKSAELDVLCAFAARNPDDCRFKLRKTPPKPEPERTAPEFVGLPFRVGTKWLTVRIPKAQFDAAMADAVEPIGLPVWNGIGQPGEVMPIDKLPPAERPTPITDAATYRGWSEFAMATEPEVSRDLERQLAEALRRQGGPDIMDAVTVLDTIDGLLQRAGVTEGKTTQRRVMDLIKQRDRLAEAREELLETRKDYLCLAERLDGHDATECRANLDRIIEQRDRLAHLVERFIEMPMGASAQSLNLKRNARAALAAVEETKPNTQADRPQVRSGESSAT